MESQKEPVQKKRRSAPKLPALDFATRLRNTIVNDKDLELARISVGREVPDDVIEEVARQQAAARPLLKQYHLMHDATPTVAMARALAMENVDFVMDVFQNTDITDLGGVGDVPEEYACPNCEHRWSGAPNFRTGRGESVYIPTGRVSQRTGRVQIQVYAVPFSRALSRK